MEIEKTLKDIWNKRLGHIPHTRTADAIGVSRHTIKNALNGKCNFDTMQKINQFLLDNKDKLLTIEL